MKSCNMISEGTKVSCRDLRESKVILHTALLKTLALCLFTRIDSNKKLMRIKSSYLRDLNGKFPEKNHLSRGREHHLRFISQIE